MDSLKLLVLNCSPRSANSTSRRFTEHLVSELAARLGGDVSITRRDLGAEPLPMVTAEYAESLLLPAAEAKQRFGKALAFSDELIKELDQADVLWISTPVHNFTVPAVLKAWIDHVVRRDVTFVATEAGKVGLLRDRPTFVAVTSGGAMFHEPPRQPDFFRPYLSAVLGVIGLKDVTFLHASGLASADNPLLFVEEAAARLINEGKVQSKALYSFSKSNVSA